MLTQVRKKIVQKDIKKYSELRVLDWWNLKVGSHMFRYSHLGKQRYSMEKMEESFKKISLLERKIPYYKVNDEIYNLILCPSGSGSFLKGSNNPSDQNPIEEMKIEKAFLLGETEITQELYKAVMNKNPSYFKKKPKNPVECVSWYDALIFCNRLSDMFKLERYYTITKDGQIVDTIETKQENYVVETNGNSKGFRLPTEWEWEYAAKADTQLEYSGSNDVNEVGWYKDNLGGTTHEIKGKNPNAWGFYDMSGNVWEWCENKYNPNNTAISADRVIRGGGWNSHASLLRSANRDRSSPDFRGAVLGFRVCRYI
jgi:sulfatase modifying factor 1